MNKREEIDRLLEEFASKLMEHADSIQLFASYYDSETGDTHGVSEGAGNIYARIGQVREWTMLQEDRQRC